MARSTAAHPPMVHVTTFSLVSVAFLAFLLGVAYLLQVVTADASDNPLTRALSVNTAVWQYNFFSERFAIDDDTLVVVGYYAGRFQDRPENDEEWEERARSVARVYDDALGNLVESVYVEFYDGDVLRATYEL